MSAALLRYRWVAYLVGTLLIVLVLIGVPLQYAAGHPSVVAIVGPIHGFCYLVYLVLGYDLARRAKLSFWTMVAIAAAGLIPFLTFVVERKVSTRVLDAVSTTERIEPARPSR